MQTHRGMIGLILMTLILTSTGCGKNENERLAEMAERQSERLFDQSRQMSELQHEVAEGSRELVTADAQARQEFVGLQHDLQAAQTEVDRQRDLLESERRELAQERRWTPILAEAIAESVLLLACLLPIGLSWYLLQYGVKPGIDQAAIEILLEDVVSEDPKILTGPVRDSSPT